MLPSAETKFDYAALPIEKAASARAAAERIRGRMQLAAESIIEVGRELIEQKKALGHGNFLLWIEAEFGMSADTAQNLMRIYTEFGENTEHVRYLPYRALIALSSPSTPEPVRTEVLERTAQGEKVTAKEIEDLKRKLANAKSLAIEKESQRHVQEARADIAAKQSREAAQRAMFATADKERLTDEVESLVEEISLLKEDGTIHVMPQSVVQQGLPIQCS